MTMSDAPSPHSPAPIAFNPLHPDFRADPHPTLHRLRREDPVHHAKLLDVWVLTRYADNIAALRDPRLSASAKKWRGYERFFLRPGIGEKNTLDEMYGRWMLQLDAPDHTRLRSLVNAAFTPRSVERLRGWIQAAVDGLLDHALAKGETFDAVSQLAYPLPLLVISHMLGVAPQDQERVKTWCEALLPSFTPAMSLKALTSVNRTLVEFRAYFEELVAQRRWEPGEDLLSAMVAAQTESGNVTDEELLATCILLAFAGHASTVQGLSSLLLLTGTHPEQLAALKADASLVSGAVEETLRFESPLQLIYRVTAERYEAGGKMIEPGEMIFLSLPAANRDPERFADPDRFDIRRTDNRHIAFGFGGHFCAGAGLARLEMQVMLQTFLRRFESWSPEGVVPPRESSLLLRGLRTLPMRVVKR